jgi:hypothetical protein
MFNKRGISLAELAPVVIIMVTAIILTVIGAKILTTTRNTQCSYGYLELNNSCANATGGTGGTLGDTFASNITGQGLFGLNEFGKFFQTIGIVLAASVVIGILVTSFRIQ